MEWDNLLFDLDGTLTDPKVGITKSVQHALSAFGIEGKNPDDLCCFIGPPLKEAFMEFYGFEEEQAGRAVSLFREYYSAEGWLENEVYAGIEGLLQALVSQEKRLYVASSKPEVYVRKILKHFQLDSYFSFLGGADFEEIRVKKADVIRYVLEEGGILDLSRTVMIGDRKHDVEGARKLEIFSIGVLYGYGSREELQKAGVQMLAETVFDLRRKLTGKGT